MGSFKIQALSQKSQPISNSTGEAQTQTKQIENVLEVRLLLELPPGSLALSFDVVFNLLSASPS